MLTKPKENISSKRVRKLSWYKTESDATFTFLYKIEEIRTLKHLHEKFWRYDF